MNSTSCSSPPRVFIDTTVLCGAIRTNGINRSLFRLARAAVFFTPVLSRVCLFEFYKHAHQGLGQVRYSFHEIEEFLNEFVYPLCSQNEIANSRVGRESVEVIIAQNRPVGDVLIELSGCSHERALEIVQQQEMHEPLRNFDRNDFHIWVTAIEQDCDVILTSNAHRFPSQIGRIRRVHPKQFYGDLNLG